MKGDLSLHDVLEVAIHAAMEDVHTVLPGRVRSYDGHAKRTATVQPSIRMPMLAGPMLDIPAIHGVPMVFPSTKAGTLLFPVAPGDGVLILFSEVGIGKYMDSTEHDVADPDFMHRHSLTDAIAIPGMWSSKAAPGLPDADLTKTILASAEGALVELGAKLRLKNDTSDLRAELDKLWDAVIDIRTSLYNDFTALSLAVTGDASFLLGTVASATLSATESQLKIPDLNLKKAALAELLT